MKKIIFCLLFLIAIFALCLFNLYFINQKTAAISTLLDASISYINEENWEMAEEKLLAAQELWNKSESYFYTVLDHSKTDEIHSSFVIAAVCLQNEDAEGSLTSCHELSSSIQHISEMEALTLRNIL